MSSVHASFIRRRARRNSGIHGEIYIPRFSLSRALRVPARESSSEIYRGFTNVVVAARRRGKEPRGGRSRFPSTRKSRRRKKARVLDVIVLSFPLPFPRSLGPALCRHVESEVAHARPCLYSPPVIVFIFQPVRARTCPARVYAHTAIIRPRILKGCARLSRLASSLSSRHDVNTKRDETVPPLQPRFLRGGERQSMYLARTGRSI